MAKWLGPGVLKTKDGKTLNPGDNVEKSALPEARYNQLVDKGKIEGSKKPSGTPNPKDKK